LGGGGGLGGVWEVSKWHNALSGVEGGVEKKAAPRKKRSQIRRYISQGKYCSPALGYWGSQRKERRPTKKYALRMVGPVLLRRYRGYEQTETQFVKSTGGKLGLRTWGGAKTGPSSKNRKKKNIKHLFQKRGKM